MPFFYTSCSVLGLFQSKVSDEPPLHQLCTLPSSHSDLGLGSGVLPSMRSGFGVSGL